jgi:hypothetical protein
MSIGTVKVWLWLEDPTMALKRWSPHMASQPGSMVRI